MVALLCRMGQFCTPAKLDQNFQPSTYTLSLAEPDTGKEGTETSI